MGTTLGPPYERHKKVKWAPQWGHLMKGINKNLMGPSEKKKAEAPDVTTIGRLHKESQILKLKKSRLSHILLKFKLGV